MTVAIRPASGRRSATGDGPVDAAFAAINPLLDIPVTLVEYTIGAVTGGADALGEVRVVVESDGRTFASQAVSTDVTEAPPRHTCEPAPTPRLRPSLTRTRS